jgi:hypothetical protein
MVSGARGERSGQLVRTRTSVLRRSQRAAVVYRRPYCVLISKSKDFCSKISAVIMAFIKVRVLSVFFFRNEAVEYGSVISFNVKLLSPFLYSVFNLGGNG